MVDGTSYLTSLEQQFPPGTIIYAIAEFPSYDRTGLQIQVNLNRTNSLSSSQLTYILTHEMGHCLGLRHSNWQGSETEGSYGAILIPGTPQTDSYSIMNSGGSGGVPSWTDFSAYDKIAVQNLYPYGTYDNWILSPADKFPNNYINLSEYEQNVNITWNNNLVTTNTVTIQVWQHGQLKAVIGSNIPNNGSYSYPIAQHLTDHDHYEREVQLRIISDSNPAISDYSRMFYMYID